MTKRVREIKDLIIDEVSLVDRGANQHASVTIAKSYDGEEEKGMDIFDEQGNPLDADALEDGAIVYGEDGQAYLYTAEDDDEIGDEDYEGDYEDDYEDEPEMVGKSAQTAAFGRFGSTAKESAAAFGGTSGWRGAASSAGNKVFGQGAGARKRKIGLGVGVGTAAVGGGGYAGYKKGVKKNLSSAEVLREELSKALTDDDRDAVIAKALGALDEYAEQAYAAEEIAKAERDLRLDREYSEIAKSYNLPVHPEVLGPVMKRLAENMSEEDCVVIAKCFEAASEALWEEAGYVGGGDNVDIFQQAEAVVDGIVSKRGGSREQALTELFEQNPDAYDEYLAENER